MKPVSVEGYAEIARAKMDPGAWDYFDGGSGEELTLRWNREAFARYAIRPRVLTGIERADVRTTVLGTEISSPVLVAPMAYHALAHPDAECETARGVNEARSLLIASTMGSRTIEQTGAALAGAPLWFQLYVMRDRALSERLVQRAVASGARALVLTVDAPRLGLRERDARNGFALPASVSAANLSDVQSEETLLRTRREGASAIAVHAAGAFDPTVRWDAVSWLGEISGLPVVVKGIMTGEDAALAVSHGASAVCVSNHGGRQLDGTSATLEVLSEVVDAVQGRCEVYLDGGVRRGTDVLKAVALGARAVLVGRPVLWGLSADGAAGVARVLGLLREELELAMVLAGRGTVAALDRSAVQRRT